ncbi:MAG TPA: NADH-quinone oxidoreductase subunit M, partial [Bacillus bacterium]|nr:NADH-quinone oxidoreductase subunit M [Bacillus sp. (in: firmicutes)]
MDFNYFLTLLVFSPLLGILMVSFMPKVNESGIKWLGFLATLPSLLLALIAYFSYRGGTDLASFSEKLRWIQFGGVNAEQAQLFSVNYELGIDGFSLVMIVLTTVIATLAALASFHIKKEWKGYYMLFLLLEIGMLGV